MFSNLYLLIILSAFAYSQCEYNDVIECENSQNCNWVEDIQYANCSNFGSSSSCENYSEYGCSWEFSWGGWQNYGSSCVGGSFQIDNSYCENIECGDDEFQCDNGFCIYSEGVCNGFDDCQDGSDETDCEFSSECSDYSSESFCDNSNGCEWLEDIETGYCQNHNTSASCPNYPVCSWSCQGGWYLGECVGWYACTGGSYVIDNSFCEEIEMPECSDLITESHCNHLEECEWVNNISYGNCGNLSVNQCYNYPEECYIDSNPGWYDSSGPYCTGGTYQINNSYCEEIDYILGDINSDSIINVLDVIQTVNLILNNQHNEMVDMNSDEVTNIQDIIYIINIILNSDY